MRSRFTCPDFTDNPIDIPDEIRSKPRPEVDAASVEVFGVTAHLHIAREDGKPCVRKWTARAFVRSPKGRWCMLDSETDFRHGDTPDDIGSAFAVDVANMVIQTLEES